MIRFCTKHPVVWIIQPAVRANLGKEKNTTKGGERARLLSLSLKSSPPPPPPTPAASGELRRRAARPPTPHSPLLPTLRPDSPLPVSTARSKRHPHG